MKACDEVDRILLSKVFSSKSSTAKEGYYLELGIQPIFIMIKSRRIKYLHYLLQRKEEEMIYNFFVYQWFNPKSGDWCELVKKDLCDFDISSDLSWIKSQSKHGFKKYVNDKTKTFTFNYLTKKQKSHSKV